MEKDTEYFDDTWTQITNHLKNDGLISKWRSTIKEMYGEQRRHYHTMTHVDEMLGFLEQYAGHIEHAHVLAYSIIYHDIIYNPKAKDNEEKSANLFKEFAKEARLEEDMVETVVEYILATKSHTAPSVRCNSFHFNSQDLAFFLDFDMAVLGRHRDGYNKYAAEIRQEYIHLPDDTFASRRIKVLQNMLEMPNIYGTEIFRNLYQQKARENIAAEIQQLQSTV